MPSWFGFPLLVRAGAPFTRADLIRAVDARKIGTRLLFGGNLVRQPAYADSPRRIIGSLENTDFVMNRVFWIGVFPGITAPMVEYIVAVFHALCGRKAAGAL